MPTPPTTCNAPVIVDVEGMLPDNVNVLLYVGTLDPLLTSISPAVLVFTKLVEPIAD